MGNVTFLGMKLADRVQVDVVYEVGSSLLDLANKNHIPLTDSCEQENCGSCAVKIAPLQPATHMVHLSDKERYLLLAAGKISRAQYQLNALPDHPPLWRLPCEYMLADEKIMVAF